MNALVEIRIWIMIWLPILLFFPSQKTYGELNIGILPVNISLGKPSSQLNDQGQSIAVRVQDYFILELQDLGGIHKLSREHILLLLKEIPAQNPDNLTEEEYKIICKREKLNYLIKCSIKPIHLEDNVPAQVLVVIYDGSNGKKFWVKEVAGSRTISSILPDEGRIFDEILKPPINSILSEIRILKL